MSEAPHPAASTRMGRSSPDRPAITSRAMSLVSDSSPAWMCRAPQHGAIPPVGSTPAPAASSTRCTARCTSRCQASITQPVNSQTSSPEVRSRGRRSGILAGSPKRLVGSSRSLMASAIRVEPAISRRRCRSIRMARRCQPGVIRPAPASAARVPSIRWPNGTALGQAVSQPRHCTHVSIERTRSSVTGAPSFCTARISAIRPRGDSVSRPVITNVGQCGRHSPQETQATSSSSSKPRYIRASAGGRGPGSGGRWDRSAP